MNLSFYSRPPEKISKEIKKIIRDLKKIFGKNKSSKSPLPHLTIRSSLTIPKKDFSKVCKILKEEFKKLKKPIVKIEGWSNYTKEDIYCIQLDIKNKKQISLIYNKLEKLFPEYKKTYKIRFNPHISLAWNMKTDMKKGKFDKTLKYLKKSKFKFKRKYIFEKLYIYEKISKDKYRFIKVIK